MAAEETTMGATTATDNTVPANVGVCVEIEQGVNGLMVTGRMKDGYFYRGKTYVFKTLDEAMKEIPSIMSVVKTEAMEQKAKNKSNSSCAEPCDD